MSDIELAWAAGFFDGEGTTCCVIDKNRHISLSVSQKERDPLERFQSAVGLGSIYGPSTSQKAPWRFSTGKLEDVKIIMRSLWPYLCGSKKTQFIRALEKYNNWQPIEDINYTLVKCSYCDMHSRPGPIARHEKTHQNG
jgi:hypothetical protein